MVIVESYFLAVIMCVITMICWGSWANTQKMATKEWPFQLYYWDYSIGVVILSVIFAFTLGSFGSVASPFLADIAQAAAMALLLAFLGGVIFNIANILLVAAIDIAGMAVAFPIGIGLALVLGVITNYMATPLGDPVILFIGVGLIVVAVLIDAIAYKRLPAQGQKTTAKGIWISISAGILMGFFYRFVAASMSTNFASPEVGKLTPYTAVFIFSLGLFFSNFIWNSIVMAKPFVGNPVPYSDYFKKGNMRLHLIGILGGIIWNIGMSLNIIAAGTAGFAISYGLGQGATMIAAFWGVFIWKEFKEAPEGTNKLLGLMFLFFLIGLVMIIMARFA